MKESFDLIHSKVKQWNWVVPSMAAFVTSFVMLAIVQQAMKWRPWIYVTGAASTGKTTFWENILQHIYGGLVERLDKSTAHATAQTIGNSGRIPVFDEFEKHKHIPEILELAKLFNKGGQKTSGTGADKAHRFDLHHMPWFGSIYLPKKFIRRTRENSALKGRVFSRPSDKAGILGHKAVFRVEKQRRKKNENHAKANIVNRCNKIDRE